MDLLKIACTACVTWWFTNRSHTIRRKKLDTESQLAGTILRMGEEDSDSDSSATSQQKRNKVIENDYIKRVAEDLRHTEVPNLLMLSATLLKLIRIQQDTLKVLKLKNLLMCDRMSDEPLSTPSAEERAGFVISSRNRPTTSW
eukprot:jgi/Mesvir1/11347/Mv04461-RA.1